MRKSFLIALLVIEFFMIGCTAPQNQAFSRVRPIHLKSSPLREKLIRKFWSFQYEGS